MNNREVMQQALEALTSRDGDGWTRRFARDRAIEALEAALAEPCQCGDRPAAECPGAWEPGCDLGANEAHAKVHEANEAFGKRQEWWNDRMFELEKQRDELLKLVADQQAIRPPLMLADKESYELGRLHGAAAEREACARVAEEYLDDPFLSGHGYATGCARAIREREDE